MRHSMKHKMQGWGGALLFPLMITTALMFSSGGCRTSENRRSTKERLTERVFVVNIVNDEQKLKEYLQYHAHVWPEVEAGFRKAGFRTISLYRFNYSLVMTIVVPEGADLAQMGKTAESYDPRCAAWNRIMDGYQQGVPGTKPGETWAEATRYYRFSKD